MEVERERRGDMRVLLAEMEHVHSLATEGELTLTLTLALTLALALTLTLAPTLTR